MLVFSLAACGGNGGDADNSKIKEYVAENKAELLSSMEQSFAASAGLSCDSDIEVKGMGFVISLNIHGLDNVPAEQKTAMKEACSALSGTFESALEMMQKELEKHLQ